MKEKITKEQLQKQVVELEKDNKEWREASESRRKEFAKAFSWYKPTQYYNSEREPMIPTWEQIFVEVGKLIAARNFMNFEDNISELQVAVEELRKKSVICPECKGQKLVCLICGGNQSN